MEKTYRTYKLDITDKMDLTLHTFDRTNPAVIFLRGNCWVTPMKQIEHIDVVENYISEFKKNFKSTICKTENFENKFIFDVDMKYHRLIENQRTYFEFEIFFKQKQEKFLTFVEVKKQFENESINVHILDLINNLENCDFKLEMSG
ncbi:MAG: hypothetical protein IKV87_08205 [Methanobrevibacter sp.]|nr:hypothetical protein [Methanobrevibacter sp.]MBR6515283.1 hypothetical protein [Bacilli bacterium]